MVVQVGVMELPVAEDPDDIQTYMNGEHVSGGLWTALTRSSNHDHSGGLSGVQLGATSIPDGSITTAKLDPAVLLPYALVDGSKPFTGQVTMQADAILRDTLYFGPQGSADPADATLGRTAARQLAANSTLTLTPAAGQPALTAQGTVHAAAPTGVTPLVATVNGFQKLVLAAGGTTTMTPDAGQLALVAQGGVQVAAAAGVAPLQATVGGFLKLSLAATGLLTLNPDAATDALVCDFDGTGRLALTNGAFVATNSRLGCTNNLEVQPAGQLFHPSADNTVYCGFTGVRWVAVHAVAGTIQTSLAEAKEGITPLDPADCYQAAKDVVWYEFAYLPPAYTAPEPPPEIAYDAADDNDTKAEKKALRDEAEAGARAAYLKLVAETAPARHQRGFVFGGAGAKDEAGGALPPVPALFGLEDRQSTTAQADLATLGCALQELIRKVEALEATAR